MPSLSCPRGVHGHAVLSVLLTLLAGSLQALCPEGAPSCTTTYGVDASEWSIEVEGICEDLDGAVIQADQSETEDGTIRSLVFHPLNDEGAYLEGNLNLALLVPGVGQNYIYYDDLMSHLAAQGIVAVSVEANYSAVAAQRADILLCALRNMTQRWSGSTLNGRVALLGHSRGGEAAVMAAVRRKELELEGSPYEQGIDLRAVVGIAPASNCDQGSGCLKDEISGYTRPHADLRDEASLSLFVIQGSRDNDVDGEGLQIYEDASSERDPLQVGAMTKAMIWTYGVEHTQWGGHANVGAKSEAKVLARAYIGSFLKWWLNGEGDLRRYFTGEAIPVCVQDPSACELNFEPSEIFPQYREGHTYNGSRLKIHDFEAPQPLHTSYLGGVFDVPVGSARVESLELYPTPYNSHVTTDAAIVPLRSVRESSLRFHTGNHPVLMDYAILSLRLGKNVIKLHGGGQENCLIAAPGDLGFRIALRDYHGNEHEVASADYQQVTDPDIYWKTYGNVGCKGEVYLTTVRVPVLTFWQGGVDPESVLDIILSFDTVPDDGYLQEAFVDSVELTISDIDPHCGNSVVESPELCDGFPPAEQSCLDYGFVAGDLGCTTACLPDTSACIAAVCGNGVVEGDEECDDGNLSGYDGCNSDCTICPAGETNCRCLGTEPGEEDPDLPFDGVLGDGTYCNDDVLYGGLNRCVEMVGGKRACISCTVGSGAFCPCDPLDGGLCFSGYDAAWNSDVVTPDTAGDANMVCSFSLRPPHAPGGLDPANSFGYCFANGEFEDEGGEPPWFQDWYCQSWHVDAVATFDPEHGNLCDFL